MSTMNERHCMLRHHLKQCQTSKMHSCGNSESLIREHLIRSIHFPAETQRDRSETVDVPRSDTTFCSTEIPRHELHRRQIRFIADRFVQNEFDAASNALILGSRSLTECVNGEGRYRLRYCSIPNEDIAAASKGVHCLSSNVLVQWMFILFSRNAPIS